MNPSTLKDAEKLFTKTSKGISALKKTEVAISAPYIYFEKLKKISKKISLGAQDVSREEGGPFTGEISAEMLYDFGIKLTIVGHSERRSLGETNTDINKKIKQSLASGIIPVLCVGEMARDENHDYFNVIRSQLEECLQGVSKNSIAKVIIAYEPVWAISSTPGRRDATPHDSLEMSIFIRKILSDKFGKEVRDMRILYGGSVNEKDAASFLHDGGVNGLLVGKASLNAEKFIEIIKICEALGN